MPRRPRSERLDPRWLRRHPLPPMDARGTKESRGSVLIVAGGAQVPGAAILAATAALRAGAGKLQIATVKSVAPVVAGMVPEALVSGAAETRRGGFAASAAQELAKVAERHDAVLVGPGMVDSEPFVRALLRRVRTPKRVLDAGALVADAVPSGDVALTPHAGEMAALLGIERAEVEADPAAIALRAASHFGAYVALKGAETYIADPDGRLVTNAEAGNAGLGTSGSGDTLSGIVAGLLARGADPLRALAWAVFLHGAAGDVLAREVGPIGYLPRELLAEVPRLLARFSSGRRRSR